VQLLQAEFDEPLELHNNWGWSQSPLDKTIKPLGQIDYIGGFASRNGLELEAYMTPVIRCLESGGNGKCRCVSVMRLGSTSVRRRFKLKHLWSATMSGLNELQGSSRQYRARGPVVREQGSDDLAFVQIDIRDDRSACLPFEDIRKQRPELIQLIDDWCPCPDSVSFFIIDDDYTTIVLPTASILTACYHPQLLGTHLNGGPKETFSSSDCAFDGFSFGPRRYSTFPFRAARNLERAEHEVSQIIPRALAYYQLHGTFAPLLVRTPFVGRTDIRGRATAREIVGRTLLLFTAEVEFYTAVGGAVSSASLISRNDLQFAPHLYRRSGLRHGGEIKYLQREKVQEHELYDVHRFRTIEERVAAVLSSYAGRLAPRPSAILEIRRWAAMTLRDSHPAFPESCLLPGTGSISG
jgi:hypothetical protein